MNKTSQINLIYKTNWRLSGIKKKRQDKSDTTLHFAGNKDIISLFDTEQNNLKRKHNNFEYYIIS